jgi:hypothetical protein
MTKSDKITIEFINNPEADVNKLAKKYKTAPSYVYKMRARALQHTNDKLRDSEREAAMETLAETSRQLESLSTTMSNTDDGWQITTGLSALDVQVGGEHYKKHKIQPIEYIHANNLPFIEGNIVKYITRWREKNGVKDLEKVKHYVDLLIQLEKL